MNQSCLSQLWISSYCFVLYVKVEPSVVIPITHVQAPVSDREYRATLPETAAMIDLASKMISEGRGSELMPKEADPEAPMTANRWVCNLILS